MTLPTESIPYQYNYKGGDVLKTLQDQQQKLAQYLENLTDEQAQTSYAPNKWTVKELLGHLIDTERIMTYRALAIARGEQQPLPGFDEDKYVAAANFNAYPLTRLLVQFHAQRGGTIQLIASFTPEMLAKTGTANDRTISVKEITEKIAAHELHHLSILEERYLTLWR